MLITMSRSSPTASSSHSDQPNHHHLNQQQQKSDSQYEEMLSPGLSNHSSNSHHGSSGLDAMHASHYESTADGDIVVVQPSFDDSLRRTSSTSGKHHHLNNHHNHQRSFSYHDAEWKIDENDASGVLPEQRYGYHGSHHFSANHSRNLSAHFFDATTLTDTTIKESDDVTDAFAGNIDVGESTGDDSSNRKHRRIFSNDVSNPSYAHRRINSIGQSKPVSRRQRHNRENSEGLDILSAAVDASVGAPDAIASVSENAERVTEPRLIAPWDPPASKTTIAPSESKYDASEPLTPYKESTIQPTTTTMHPPSQPYRRAPYTHAPPPSAFVAYPPPPPHHAHYYPATAHAPPFFQPPTLPGMYRMGPPPQSSYPVQYSQRPTSSSHYSQYRDNNRSHSDSGSDNSQHERKRVGQTTPPPTLGDDKSREATAMHQGSQTFVTAIAVDSGDTRIDASRAQKSASTSTDDLPVSMPTEVQRQHRRSHSSFSSFGTFPGSGLFASTSNVPLDFSGSMLDLQQRPGHHRVTSSSLSFLQGLDVGLDGNDANFLRDLHASGNTMLDTNQLSSNASQSTLSRAPSNTESYSVRDSSPAQSEGVKLASGGTSKRIRRKCTIEGCPNRVVQGGLCISHGAKRKTCNHPGCAKNVKKAGMCSTHGPARKRCEFESCNKVAVQGGRCIAHGAKKKLCHVDGCTKQAILSGMCKKHHDQSSSMSRPYCQEVNSSARSSSESECSEEPPSVAASRKHKPKHTRGLSIFQEISADAVQSLLNDK